MTVSQWVDCAKRPSQKKTIFMSEENCQSHLLSKKDWKKFKEFGEGRYEKPAFACIHYAFEHFAAIQADAIAVEHLEEKISYGELNRQAENLAARLRASGVGVGDHVGLFLERSIPMVVGILAVLKTGAAYVPQDARVVPTKQLRHIIKMCGMKKILTLSHLRHRIPASVGEECIAIDESLKTCTKADQAKRTLHVEKLNPLSSCFILFTSGTTGMPNGVTVTHKNITNILLTSPGDLKMAPGLKVSQILNISFDMAAWEILGALSHGATLLIRGKDISETVEKVDVVIATPSILASLNADRCKKVKVAAVAGEPCPKPLADKWSSFATFYNSCGPTETTIVNTMQEYKNDGRKLTIGKPTPNNTVYILNDNLKPCAIGEVGEMWAGGDCVSQGYLGNEKLTKDRYKPDPFLGEGHYMFRTRDLGRWTENGELEHFGRTDDQVKIRGFRVELDSVSAALESVASCKQAVTLKLDSRNLVAFVRPRTVNLIQAKQSIEALLPYYCTPSMIVPLDEFPVTERGKIDKKALTILAVEKQDQLNVQVKKGNRDA